MPGEVGRRGPVRVHDEDLLVSFPIALKENLRAVRGNRRDAVVRRVIRQARLARTVGVHDIDLGVPVTIALEDDPARQFEGNQRIAGDVERSDGRIASSHSDGPRIVRRDSAVVGDVVEFQNVFAGSQRGKRERGVRSDGFDPIHALVWGDRMKVDRIAVRVDISTGRHRGHRERAHERLTVDPEGEPRDSASDYRHWPHRTAVHRAVVGETFQLHAAHARGQSGYRYRPVGGDRAGVSPVNRHHITVGVDVVARSEQRDFQGSGSGGRGWIVRTSLRQCERNARTHNEV